MSPIDQVLAAARALEESGKVPSLALIKPRISNKIPMPMIIQGLQQYKSMPKAERERLAKLQSPVVEASSTESSLTLDTLAEKMAEQFAYQQARFEQLIIKKNNELTQLHNELLELKQRVQLLESQGKDR
ncbi:hypothetical protein L9G16_01495 [Shewanella sp. A25]|nr:hypothetical protein [Shewanella shenzhenensis]